MEKNSNMITKDQKQKLEEQFLAKIGDDKSFKDFINIISFYLNKLDKIADDTNVHAKKATEVELLKVSFDMDYGITYQNDKYEFNMELYVEYPQISTARKPLLRINHKFPADIKDDVFENELATICMQFEHTWFSLMIFGRSDLDMRNIIQGDIYLDHINKHRKEVLNAEKPLTIREILMLSSKKDASIPSKQQSHDTAE